MEKKSKKTCTKKVNEQCAQKYLQNEINSVYIHILNDDCLRHIFLFLPIIDRVRIERVCKHWRILSQDSWHMMKTLDLSPFTWGSTENKISTVVLCKILLKCGKFLTQINLSPKHSKHCLTQSILTIIGKFCPNVESIDVTGLRVCASSIQTLAKNCRNITKFNLGSSTNSCDNKLKDFFKINQNLEYFGISKNLGISGKCLLWLPAQTMHTITLDRCIHIQDNHLSLALKNLENLRHLTIDNCIGIGKHTFEVVSKHCKNMRVLELNGDFLSAQTADMLYLTHLANLQILRITDNSKIFDEFFVNLVHHCQQLTCIDITGCIFVTDAGLAAIATLLKLEKLTINHLDHVTDDGLQNMCSLRELCCQRCPSIKDQGISMLIKSSPQLQLLDLSGCEHITNVTFEAAKHACNSRSNNLILRMIIGGTSIFLELNEETQQSSPFLQTVNDDLSMLSDSVNDIDMWSEESPNESDYFMSSSDDHCPFEDDCYMHYADSDFSDI